jgi:hypothetical protein
MPKANYTPGLVHFSDLSITNTAGKEQVEVKKLLAEFRYYEDIFSPAVSATLTLIDGTALQETLPIVGGEKVKIRFAALDDLAEDEELKYVEISASLTCYKVSKPQNVNEKTVGYTLFMTTDTFLTNNNEDRLVRRGFRGKPIVPDRNTDPNAIGVLEDLMDLVYEYTPKGEKKKALVTETTEGVFNYTFPSVSPFKAINILCSQAKSAKNPASNYVFFESDEYYFITLQELVKQGNIFDPVETYYFIEETEGLEKPKDLKGIKDWQKILMVEEVAKLDILNSSTEGAFGGVTKTFDPMAKSFSRKEYNYEKDFKTDKDSQSTLTAESSKKFAASPTSESFHATNATIAKSNYATSADPGLQQGYKRTGEFAAEERAATQQLLSQRINVAVHGNSRLRVGKIVDLQFPLNTVTKEGGKKNDEYKTGKYLILAVMHVVDALGKYTTVMECAKDSFEAKPEPESDA